MFKNSTYGDRVSPGDHHRSISGAAETNAFDTVRADAYSLTTSAAADASRGASGRFRDGHSLYFDTSDTANLYASTVNAGPRERLERYIAAHPREGAAMQADLQALEARLKGRPDGERQMQDVLRAVNSLLDATDRATLKPAQSRETVAAQILKHSARPGEVNQGGFNACAFASLETEMYSRQPGRAAELVASAALTGKYQNNDGSVGSLDRSTINNWSHELAAGLKPYADGLPPRDHASQIFQALAFDSKLQGDGGSYRFMLRPGDASSPSGETVIDPKRPHENLVFSHLPNALDYQATYERLTGQKSNGVVTVDDAANGNELKEQLQRLKAEGRLPVAVMVNSMSKPMVDAVGSDNAVSATISGVQGHMITVTDIAPDGTVQFRNHLNGQKEEAVSSRELFSYMTYPRMTDAALAELAAALHMKVPNDKLDSSGIAPMLRMINPDQRAAFIAAFEKESGLNLDERLADADRTRLGLQPWYKFWK